MAKAGGHLQEVNELTDKQWTQRLINMTNVVNGTLGLGNKQPVCSSLPCYNEGCELHSGSVHLLCNSCVRAFGFANSDCEFHGANLVCCNCCFAKPVIAYFGLQILCLQSSSASYCARNSLWGIPIFLAHFVG